jgi:effector-binding domain-containing protein
LTIGNCYPENSPVEIEIIDQTIRFRLYGLSSFVDNHRYGEVGCRLMDEMWNVVKEAKLKTTGINHWVYFADDRMFVGIDVKDAKLATIPAKFEPCEFELTRYAKHIHIGPYHELPQKWRSLKADLSARGEIVTMPSLEVYGHSCEGQDESKAETTILIGLKPKIG